MLGRTEWFDLPVADLADAMSFYEGLLGWTYRKMENSLVTDYAMIEVGGKLIGGLRKVASPRTSSAPLPMGEGSPILYFTVEKLVPKIARAKELGAEVVGPMVELGKERGHYQWIRDREKHLIGLWAVE